jgi:AAA domain
VKLVFVYGPPAVGKLTVSTELAKITGYRLFHNHLSVDFVRSVFDFGTPSFWKLVDRFRKGVIEEAATQAVDTIFTFVYSKGDDDPFVKDVIKRVEEHNGIVCFVRLHCDREELLRRVGGGRRKEMGKLSNRSDLSRLLFGRVLDAEVPFAPSLSIDTTVLSPRRAARVIAGHYGLPTQTRRTAHRYSRSTKSKRPHP